MEQVPPRGSCMGDGCASLGTLRPPPADFSGQDCPGHLPPIPPPPDSRLRGVRQLSFSCQMPVGSLQLWLFSLWPGSCWLECGALQGCGISGFSTPLHGDFWLSLVLPAVPTGPRLQGVWLRRRRLASFRVFMISGRLPWWDSTGRSSAVHARLVPKPVFVWCWLAGWQLQRAEPTPRLYLHGWSGLCPTDPGFLADVSWSGEVFSHPRGLELLLTGSPWLPLLGWWRTFSSLWVSLIWALHRMNYLLKHWIQINFSTCFAWPWCPAVGKCSFSSLRAWLAGTF